MKRNTIPVPIPAVPVPARSRAATLQPTLPGLSAPKTAKTNSAAVALAPTAKPRPRTIAPVVKPAAKIAKTNLAPTKTPVKAAAAKTTSVKTAKTNSVTKPTAAQAVRVVNEPVFEGGSLWKMSGKNGVAYVKDAALAGELLAVDPKKLAQAAMAVYYDKKGKPFAWQVRFDTARWDEILRRLA